MFTAPDRRLACRRQGPAIPRRASGPRETTDVVWEDTLRWAMIWKDILR